MPEHSTTTRSVTTHWLASELNALSRDEASTGIIRAADIKPVLPGFEVWDLWPLQDGTNAVAKIAGGQIWFCLAVPTQVDPEERHDIARIRAILHRDDVWHDLGNVFPDGLTPGSREWSGSAVVLPDLSVIFYFTATGRRGEASRSFEQRLFLTVGELSLAEGLPRFAQWTAPEEIAANDGRHYRDVGADSGAPDNLKAYRDPGFFIDPANGETIVFFAASLAVAAHGHDAAIGAATAQTPRGPFQVRPPVISAEGVCKEMERPHMVLHDEQYYLFWSSHGVSFAPETPDIPTGLFGVVGASPLGPFRPLNGSGLVVANPKAEPFQAYCWQVLDTLEVVSFINYWGLDGQDIADPKVRRAHFGGTFAPVLHIELHGDRAVLAEPA